MRGFDSYYFDARVSKNCSAFAVVRSRSWCARWPVSERSGPAEGVAVGTAFSLVLLVLASFEFRGWHGSRTASQNRIFVFGLLFWSRTAGFV